MFNKAPNCYLLLFRYKNNPIRLRKSLNRELIKKNEYHTSHFLFSHIFFFFTLLLDIDCYRICVCVCIALRLSSVWLYSPNIYTNNLCSPKYDIHHLSTANKQQSHNSGTKVIHDRNDSTNKSSYRGSHIISYENIRYVQAAI